MIAEELKLVIKSEVAKAKQELKDYIKHTKDAKTGHDKFIDSIKQGILKFASWTAAIALARKALKEAFDAAMYSARQQQIGLAFEQIAKQAGMAADDIVRNMQRMSAGTISEMNIMESASRAAILGIPLERMSELMEVARASATAMGADTAQMFNDLAVGIGRQSKLILDNLGINIDATNAYKDYAEQIGKTAKELTDAEQRQAYLNATLKEGKRIMEMVGEAGKNVTPLEPIQQFRAAVDDLKAALGERLLPVINNVYTKLSELFRTAADNIKAFNTLMGITTSGPQQLLGQMNEIKEAIDILQKKAKQRQFFGIYERGLTVDETALLLKLEKQLETLGLQYEVLERQRQQAYYAQQAAQRIIEEEAKLQAALTEGLGLYNVALENTLTEEEKKIRTYEDIVAGLREYRDNLLEAGETNWEHYNAVADLILKYLDWIEELKNAKKEVNELSIAMAAVGMPATFAPIFEDQMDFVERTRQAAAELNKFGWDTWGADLTDTNILMRGTVEQAESLADALLRIQASMQPFYDNMDLFVGRVQQLWAIQEILDAAKESAEAARKEMERMNIALNFAYDLGAALVGVFDENVSAVERLKNALKSAAIAMLKMAGAAMLASGNIPGALLAYAGAGAISALQHGGIVTKPTVALIGEKGPEAVVPLNKGGAPIVINQYIAGSIWADRELEGMALGAVGKYMRGY